MKKLSSYVSLSKLLLLNLKKDSNIAKQLKLNYPFVLIRHIKKKSNIYIIDRTDYCFFSSDAFLFLELICFSFNNGSQCQCVIREVYFLKRIGYFSCLFFKIMSASSFAQERHHYKEISEVGARLRQDFPLLLVVSIERGPEQQNRFHFDAQI